MHPIEKYTTHIKRYTRRSESQQEEHHKENTHRITYRSLQDTQEKTYGEAKKTDAHEKNIDKPKDTDRHPQGAQDNGQEQNTYGEAKNTYTHPEKTYNIRKGYYEAQQ
eukprot:3448115-Heterocapsa_arctica.AAC.1